MHSRTGILRVGGPRLRLRALALIWPALALGCLGPNPLLLGEGGDTADASGSDTGDGDGEPTDGHNETGGQGGTEGETSGDGDGDGDAQTCSPTQQCLARPQPGWVGPLALLLGPAGEASPGCQGETPLLVAELFTDLELYEGESTCACACGPLQAPSCSEITLRRSGLAGCGFANDTWPLGANACEPLGATQPTSSYSASGSTLISGNCSGSLVEGITPAEHLTKVVACGLPDTPQGCEGDAGVCMTAPAEPFDGRMCVASQGDVLCPDGVYSERVVYYGGVDDGRSCGTCSCAPPLGESCTGTIQLASNQCSLLVTTFAVGTCKDNVGNVSDAKFVPGPPEAPCEPSASTIEGTVVATDAWTLCCLPE